MVRQPCTLPARRLSLVLRPALLIQTSTPPRAGCAVIQENSARMSSSLLRSHTRGWN